MMHQLIQGAMAVVGIFLAAFPVGVSAEIVCFDERYAQTIKAVQQIPQTGRRIFPTPGKRGVAE